MHPSRIFEIPRYKENPSDFFFEMFVIDTISPLSTESAAWLAETIQCPLEEWRTKTRSILKLSETIEIAILDLWYRNDEISRKQGISLEAHEFSMLFVDNYYAENSLIDQWESGALDAAKQRIAAYKAKHTQ